MTAAQLWVRLSARLRRIELPDVADPRDYTLEQLVIAASRGRMAPHQQYRTPLDYVQAVIWGEKPAANIQLLAPDIHPELRASWARRQAMKKGLDPAPIIALLNQHGLVYATDPVDDSPLVPKQWYTIARNAAALIRMRTALDEPSGPDRHIEIGLAYGYEPQDIATYLVHNYDLGTISQCLQRRAISIQAADLALT